MDMNTALGIAARIWGDPEYSHIVMHPALAKEIAEKLKAHADGYEAAQNFLSAQPVTQPDASPACACPECGGSVRHHRALCPLA